LEKAPARKRMSKKKKKQVPEKQGGPDATGKRGGPWKEVKNGEPERKPWGGNISKS